jgi:hypothetical protein
MKQLYKKGFYILICVLITIVLSGCPAQVDVSEQKTGEPHRAYIIRYGEQHYGIEFQRENAPVVDIQYKLNSEIKVASYKLDGYDSEKKIGFKFVTDNDIEAWDKLRAAGNDKAPDMKDAASIEKASIAYQYPVVFVWMPDYWKDPSATPIYDKLQSIFNTDTIQKRFIGEYKSGQLYKSIIEKYAKHRGIRFSSEHTPLISVKYMIGNNQKTASFHLDGYDNNIKIGYKFVTLIDINKWTEEVKNGNTEVPDINDYEIIKEKAIDYEFPVLFIYYADYWKTNKSNLLIDDIHKFYTYQIVKLKISNSYID